MIMNVVLSFASTARSQKRVGTVSSTFISAKPPKASNKNEKRS